MDRFSVPAGWAGELVAWARWCRLADHAPSTIETRRQHLAQLARGLGGCPWEVTTDVLFPWCAARTWATETRRGHRTSFIVFWDWGISAGRTGYNPARELPTIQPALPNPRPVPTPAYRQGLMRAKGRVRLMIRLAGEAGLRRGEVAVVHAEDLREDLLGWTLRVHGKGGRDRDVPLTDDLASEVIEATRHGYAFPGRVDGHLSARWVGRLVADAMPGAWTMHPLRHRFGTLTHSVHHDLLATQKLLGHASPTTTQLYVKVLDSYLRETVNAAVG